MPWCHYCDAPSRILEDAFGLGDVHLCDATPAQLTQLVALVSTLVKEIDRPKEGV